MYLQATREDKIEKKIERK